MMEESHEPSIYTMPHQGLHVECFRPEDAQGIVNLCRSVYGEHYPIKLFYDVEAIRRANKERHYLTIVARTASGEVIGMQNLFPSATESSLYEVGAGLVQKDHRKLGIGGAMLHFIYEDYVPGQSEIEEVFGEPVCNHLFMQRLVSRFRFVETAIEIALMPGEVYEQEQSSPGRVSTMSAFRCYRPKPHRVFLPEAYERELECIYARLDDARDLTCSRLKTPSGTRTRLQIDYFDSALVARVAVREIGQDFDQSIFRLEQEATSRKIVVIQTCVDLTVPWVGSAVQKLRDRGYFFGGVLPRWLDGDALLMQRLFCPPSFDSIQLHSDVAKQLIEVIKQDWERAMSDLDGKE